ncbi:MAG: flagellar motor switch protein FliN [Armatimonadetes bacterium]|nr:flagellar motor switch protein FliN [Armatimonadota bacterium]
MNQETITKISQLQNQIWQTVSITASEASGDALTFGTPFTVETSPNDLFSEMAAPKLVIQFALANMPENSHIVLISQETFGEMIAMMKQIDPTEMEDPDESMVSDVRPLVESIVQGLCLAIGNIKNEPLISTGLSVRFQIFAFPPNLQKAESLVRTNVAITSDKVNGTLVWLMDDQSSNWIAGVDGEGNESEFARSLEEIDKRDGGFSLPEEAQNLEILLDIPLEISVELGRVRMMMKEVVDLSSGSIVEIDKAAGEPVDVLVNGRLVARGEVVVIEDNFGVRITEILSPQERLQRLNEVA